MNDFKLTKKQEQRKNWVMYFNNTLPQKKWFDEEFEIEMSIGIGGIYDSEYMNFVFDNIKTDKIKSVLKHCNLKFK